MNEETQTIMNDPWVKKGVVASLLLLALFLAVETLSSVRAYPSIGSGIPVSNTVTLSGEGEVFAVPDTATFSFSVVEEAVTVEAAQEVATKKVNDLIAFLEREGIEEKDIKTASYNVTPRYEFRREASGSIEPAFFPPQGNRTLVGFEVRQRIEVKVRDTEAAGALLSGIGGRGVSDISGLSFTVDDEDLLRIKARKEAILDAQVKAKQLARDLDVRLVRVVSFNESGGDVYPRFAFAESAFGVGGDSAGVPELPVGENKIISNVSITYEIR